MDNQLVWRLSNASLSAQSAPSPSLLTLPYLPNQPYQSHLSPSPICPNSPICLTHHPPLSAQSALSPSLLTLPYLPHQPHHPSLLTLPYLPNQPHPPHSSPSPICPISPIRLTPHPPLSAQSALSVSLITLPYLPKQPHLPHSSPSSICPISPITPTFHPPLSPKQVNFFQQLTLLSYSLHTLLCTNLPLLSHEKMLIMITTE